MGLSVVTIFGLLIYAKLRKRHSDNNPVTVPESKPDILPGTPTTDEVPTTDSQPTAEEPTPEPKPEPEPEPTPEPTPDPEPTPEPEPEPEPEAHNPNNTKPEPTPATTPSLGVAKVKSLDEIIEAFRDFIVFTKDSKTYAYLSGLYDEALAQYEGKSLITLPHLYRPENFPNVFGYYGEAGTRVAAVNTMLGWLVALQLAELKPKKRNHIFKVGYEMGGYNADSPIFGYRFECDPIVARLVASVIYVAFRTIVKPDFATMRQEVGGTAYPYGLQYYLDLGLNHLKTPEEIQKNVVNKGGFYVDLREFMPSSAGPFAPGYTDRPPHMMTDAKDTLTNTNTDRAIHEYIVRTFNLSTTDKDAHQMTVQAIADKEQSTQHLYGSNKTVGEFTFHPVFGKTTIGKKLKTDGSVANLTFLVQAIGTYFRIVLQSKAVTPMQYGRLRPGCSWSEEKKKNSDTDDRRNVLVNITIEDNDGQKTSSYGYDDNGIWVATPVERDQYEEDQKNRLGANSYPSGHSSGIWTVAMMLIEAMPERADLIMQAANQFAVNRTIARYHWTSDTLFGRLLGSVASAMCHATADYDALLKAARKEANG